jgi:uncharacterized protein
MPAELVERLREAENIFSPHPVALAWLYGSQATGRATPLSDIDVALVTEGELPPRERLRLELTLETELAAACSGQFDVRIINNAPLAVRGTVVQTGVPIYVRDDAFRVRFESRARKLYLDFLPVVRFHRKAFFAAQRAALKERGLL